MRVVNRAHRAAFTRLRTKPLATKLIITITSTARPLTVPYPALQVRNPCLHLSNFDLRIFFSPKPCLRLRFDCFGEISRPADDRAAFVIRFMTTSRWGRLKLTGREANQLIVPLRRTDTNFRARANRYVLIVPSAPP